MRESRKDFAIVYVAGVPTRLVLLTKLTEEYDRTGVPPPEFDGGRGWVPRFSTVTLQGNSWPTMSATDILRYAADRVSATTPGLRPELPGVRPVLHGEVCTMIHHLAGPADGGSG